MKRQFVQLAQTFDDENPGKYSLSGWMMSEKMDGLRVFWDGGISRGVPVREVPFANIERDARYVEPNYYATGLWSRNAKVIRAPEWWLDKLSAYKFPMDGELWGGRGNWQITSSIVKQIEPNDADWKLITYQIFDAPPFDVIFGIGEIDTDIYKLKLTNYGILDWARIRAKSLGVLTEPKYRSFENTYKWLSSQFDASPSASPIKLAAQTPLPFGPIATHMEVINNQMEIITQSGGEGLMLRNNVSRWNPCRTHDLLKVKKWYDAEATVVGYSWGRKTKTSQGGRHLGKMGALVVMGDDGKKFELSGFKDEERAIIGDVDYHGLSHPGETVPAHCENPMFPRGIRVTYRYRELSTTGIPKSGIYLRKSLIE